MRTVRSKMIIIAIAAALALLIATPAWADTTISLDPAQLPITASAYAPNPSGDRVGLTMCDIAPATAADRDVWVFHVSGAPAPSTEPSVTPEPTTSVEPTPGRLLLAVSATFADARTITVDASSDGTDGGIVDDSAWIAAPAGSTLTAASAQIAADAGTFELVAVCPAQPIATADPLAGLLPSASSTTPPETTSAPPATAPAQTLPVAGTDVVSTAALGAGLVLTGILLILAHGRRPKLADDSEEDDIRQPVIVIRRF